MRQVEVDAGEAGESSETARELRELRRKCPELEAIEILKARNKFLRATRS